jgi:hypothetical protein
MCNEIFLALIYFTIIIFVNFFLIKLIKECLEKIKQFRKIKNIFNNFDYYKNSKFYEFFNLFNSKSLNIDYAHKFLNTNDILILGSLSNYLSLQIKSKNIKGSAEFNNCYYKLLELQYLNK